MTKKISSLQHILIKHWVRLRKNRDYRDEHHFVMIEGIKMVREVCQKFPPRCLIVDEEKIDPADWESLGAEDVYLVSEEAMQKITGVLSPEGIVAEIQMPSFVPLENQKKIVVLDRVQDPGNVGTLIRSALGLGWNGIFLLEPCCDPFNEKALRAAKGATFRLPMQRGHQQELQALIQKHQGQLLAADLEGKPPEKIPQQEKKILFLGNEAQGLSDAIKMQCTSVTLPISKETESLNVAVAGGILMYLLGHP